MAGPRFACKCLNVLISSSSPSPSSSPKTSAGKSFAEVAVHDADIVIRHPQLTLRSRSAPATPTVQYTSLSCLVCNTEVYRVAHTISAGQGDKEGPIIPTLDWVEQGVLSSHTGRIDVSTACLTSDEIARAQQSPQYSLPFQIIIPASPSKLGAITANDQPPPPATPGYELPRFPHRPLFPPPPFSPSHPVFTHLSKEGERHSEVARKQAEADISALIAERIRALDAADLVIRAEVEALWRTFHDAWRMELDTLPRDDARRHDTHARPSAAQPSVSIREFAPIHDRTALKRAPPVSASAPPRDAPLISPRSGRPHAGGGASLLSASLGRVLHGPPRDNPSVSPPPYASNPSTDSDDDDTAGTDTPVPEYRAPLATYRRNMDPSVDVSTSYRYESAIAAATREVAEEDDVPQRRTPAKRPAPEPPKKVPTSPSPAPVSQSVQRTTPKAKRKVTFDIRPDVVVFPEGNAANASGPSAPPEGAEPTDTDHLEIFGDLEEIEAEHFAPAIQPDDVRTMKEPRAVQGRTARLQSLLMNMSYREPSNVLARPHQAPSIASSAPVEPLAPHEAELRRLVAADLPSHRDGWARGGKSWSRFNAGGRRRTPPPLSSDESESEAERERTALPSGIPASLPIPIGPLGAPRGTSPAVARSVAYSLRDAARGADPGLALSLVEDEDEGAEQPSGARERALQILTSSSVLPDAGMWRSLA